MFAVTCVREGNRTGEREGNGEGEEERGEWGSLHQEVRVAVPEVRQLNRNLSVSLEESDLAERIASGKILREERPGHAQEERGSHVREQLADGVRAGA